MAVALTISRALNQTPVGDSLQGGGTGLSFGAVANGSYTPLVDQVANTGADVLYYSHDAVVDPIFNVKFYIASFTLTGLTYGGQKTPAQDLTDLINAGNASGSSKNNADGNSGGLWCDMGWQTNVAVQFDASRSVGAPVYIFGDNGVDGTDPSTAFVLHPDACFYTAGVTKVAALTPEAGKIGKSNDTIRGNRAEIRWRWYLSQSYPDGGYAQVAIVIRYTYSA